MMIARGAMYNPSIFCGSVDRSLSRSDVALRMIDDVRWENSDEKEHPSVSSFSHEFSLPFYSMICSSILCFGQHFVFFYFLFFLKV